MNVSRLRAFATAQLLGASLVYGGLPLADFVRPPAVPLIVLAPDGQGAAFFPYSDQLQQPDPLRLCPASEHQSTRNQLGQIMPAPVKALPVSEIWLYANPSAHAAIKRGRADCSLAQTRQRASFAASVQED